MCCTLKRYRALNQTMTTILPASSYRVNLAIDPLDGSRIAEWITADQEIWFMKAFRQFDPENGQLLLDIRYDLLDHGGVNAGSNTEQWYRKTSTSYDGRTEQHRFKPSDMNTSKRARNQFTAAPIGFR